MPRAGEFVAGGAVAGTYPPVNVIASLQATRMRNAAGALIPAAGTIITGGSVTQEYGAQPFATASIELASPAGLYNSLLTKDDVITLERSVQMANGESYAADLGRYIVGQPRKRATAKANTLSYEATQVAQSFLQYQVSGDLPALAVDVARRYGLLAPDNATASVEGIMAYLMIRGGCGSVRIDGFILPTIAYTQTASGVRVSAFVVSPAVPAVAVMEAAATLSGIHYYTDQDGTGVLAVFPRDVTDVNLTGAPVRRFMDSGGDAVVAEIEKVAPRNAPMVQLVNQTTTDAPVIKTYYMPPGHSFPHGELDGTFELTGLIGLAEDAAAFAKESLDPFVKQAIRAAQLTYQASLEGSSVNLKLAGVDPFLQAGKLVYIKVARANVDGVYRIQRAVHPLGRGQTELVCVEIVPVEGTVTTTVTTTHTATGTVLTITTSGPNGSVSTQIVSPPTSNNPGGGSPILTPSPTSIVTGNKAIRWQIGGANTGGSVGPYTQLMTARWGMPAIYTEWTWDLWVKPRSWPIDGANVNVPLPIWVSNFLRINTAHVDATHIALTARYVYLDTGLTPPYVNYYDLSPFNIATNDAAWHQLTVQHEASGWFGVWWDGVLRQSGTGTTNGPASTSYDLDWLTLLGMIGNNAVYAVSEAHKGDVAVNFLRLELSALHAHADFAPASAPFAVSPITAWIFPLRDYPPLYGGSVFGGGIRGVATGNQGELPVRATQGQILVDPSQGVYCDPAGDTVPFV